MRHRRKKKRNLLGRKEGPVLNSKLRKKKITRRKKIVLIRLQKSLSERRSPQPPWPSKKKKEMSKGLCRDTAGKERYRGGGGPRERDTSLSERGRNRGKEAVFSTCGRKPRPLFQENADYCVTKRNQKQKKKKRAWYEVAQAHIFSVKEKVGRIRSREGKSFRDLSL